MVYNITEKERERESLAANEYSIMVRNRWKRTSSKLKGETQIQYLYIDLITN